MGQYLKGSKIGTCENMYYMRIDEAEKLAESHASDDVKVPFANYLKDGQSRFRFRFPDEDGCDSQILAGKSHNKSFMLPAGGVAEGLEHGTITHATGGAGNINIFIPCPYSQEFKQSCLKHSPIGEQKFLVVFEAYRNGKLKTIFRCGLCEVMFWLTDDDITKLKENATEYYSVYDTTGKNPAYEGNQEKYDYAMEVIKRLS